MAAAIEHRSKDTVLQAFDYFDMPNFAIYAMKDQRTAYSGNDINEAAQKLQEYLEMIEQASTSQIYTLKMYKEGTTNINSKTPHDASTTFMLNASQPVKTENGVTIIDRVGNTSTGQSAAVLQRLEKLEQDNVTLREQLHLQQLKNLEDKFTHAIAGLHQEPEKPWYERLIGAVETNPELIDKMLNPIEKMVTGIFMAIKPTKNYTEKQEFTPVNGTKNNEAMPENNSANKQQLTEQEVEEIHDKQDTLMEKLEVRIGPVVLLQLLDKVANCDDKDLNKILSFLL